MKFKEVALKEICINMHQGINTVADKVEYQNVGIPIIQSKNITAGYLDLDDVRYLDDETYLKYKDKYNPKIGDILLCNIGTIGSSIVLDQENNFLIAWNLFKLKINTELYNPKYIKYYLDKLKAINYFDRLLTGGTVKFINKTKMGDILIPICNLDEQMKIVEVLDKSKELIDKRKEQIEALDELVKSQFIEMFGDPFLNPMGWEEVKLSEILDGKTSNGFFAKRDEYKNDGNVGIVGVVSVVNRMYSEVFDIPRTNAEPKDINKFKIKYGDLLFCRSSLVAEGIGKASVVPQNVPDNTLFECHVIRIQLDLNKCVPEYIQMLTTTEYFRNQIMTHAKTSTMTTIGQDGIIKSNILLPPIEKQKEFLLFVKQVDKLKFEMQNSLKELEDNFNSLMQRAFKGELFN